MRYFIHFAYDGTAYHGWQVQPNADSVQAHLNSALSLLLREPVETLGAGRTDAGVHAKEMYAHFDVNRPLDCRQLTYKLNRLLPPDISVFDVRPVKSEAHARFDALSRTYHYFVTTQKIPFRRQYTMRLTFSVDFDAMNRAAQHLLEVSDFASFSKADTDAKTSICDVTEARWTEVEDGVWRFEITANRFLRNMVRAVVGTLLDVGRGRLTYEQFCDVVAKHSRCAAGESVPAQGLFLVRVRYPENLFLADVQG